MADTMRMHPWLRLPTRKRKSPSPLDPAVPSTSASTSYPHYYSHSTNRLPSFSRTENTDTDVEELSSATPPPAPKRRRCDNLEHGFSQLSIVGGVPSSSVWPGSTSPDGVERHPIITEPEDEPIDIEIDVDGPGVGGETEDRGWFEPEKDRTSRLTVCSPLRAYTHSNANYDAGIVITRLDSLSDSDTECPKPPSNTLAASDVGGVDPVSVSISPALLDRLKSQQQNFGLPGLLQGPSSSPANSSLNLLQSDESKAVVLFKPLNVPPHPVINEPPSEEEDEEIGTGGFVEEDADMMDVEVL